MSPQGLREAAVAGSWYPGTRDLLTRELDAHLAPAAVAAGGTLVGLISPHAGLRYSGPVAAYAYGLLRNLRDVTVVLVGPSHRAAFDGVALWGRGAFATPLGQIPIDEGLADRIRAADPIVLDLPSPHLREHSLEMQLPFLQHVVPGLRIVPLLMGTQTRDASLALAGALAAAIGDRADVILVASSDLSHYERADVAHALDAEVIRHVEGFDPEGLMTLLEEDPHRACGGGPMVAVMAAARAGGATRARVLRYADSGDAGERDKSRVVGYLAAALVRP